MNTVIHLCGTCLALPHGQTGHLLGLPDPLPAGKQVPGTGGGAVAISNCL